MESSINLHSFVPQNVPKDLTKLPFSYKLKATLAIMAVLFFFLLYAGMITGLAYLFYYAITYNMVIVNKVTILLKLGAIAGSAMLLVFTIKFLFKLRNNKATNRIRLDKKAYPELWTFIESICKETGAPKPVAIYADPDVNAYVSYTNMWLSLFLPVRKELTIGLGLVDCLNMLEFKAVMAHEFGHFSQRSMKIGSYIITANTIIYDMIYSRDSWDNWLERWKRSDFRISFAAWIITPIIWCVRQILALFYQFLHIMHSSLSREMEFNADKVAVSTAGSMAMVSSLWKLDPGTTYWQSTLHHMSLAADKQQFIQNVYHHNQLSIERGRPVWTTKEAELPADPRGGKRYFTGSETSKVSMYASHPPDHLREANAKSVFLECPSDERSPWLLFGHKEQLQEQMTALIYEQYLGIKPTINRISEEEFEAFIAEETRDHALLTEYHDTFRDRFLTIPTERELEQEARHFYDSDNNALPLLKEQLKVLMEPVWELDKSLREIHEIAGGTSIKKSFTYGNVTYSKKEMQAAFERITNEREKLLNETFVGWDASFCAYHWKLAKNQHRTVELTELYDQQRRVMAFYKLLLVTKGNLFEKFRELQRMDEVLQSDLDHYFQRSNSHIDRITEELAVFDSAKFIPLPNIETVAELKKALLNGGQLSPLKQPMFENGEFNRLIQLIESTVQGCFRVDQKMVGAILLFHKQLEEGRAKS